MSFWRCLNRHDARHRFDAFGERSVIEEGPLPGRVIADIRIATVVARVRVARDEHLALGEAVPKAIKRLQPRWNEPQVPPGHGTDEGLAGELLPPAFRLPVVHNEIRVPKLSGRSEIENAAIDHPLEHQRRVAERAVGDDDGRAAHDVVRDFVPDQHAQWIGASILPDGKGDHGLRIAECGDRSRCLAVRQPLETRRINGRNSVLRRATGFDPRERHAMFGETRARPFQPPTDRIRQQRPEPGIRRHAEERRQRDQL